MELQQTFLTLKSFSSDLYNCMESLVFISTCSEEDSSHLAFSAASRTLWRAILSFIRSTPLWKTEQRRWKPLKHTRVWREHWRTYSPLSWIPSRCVWGGAGQNLLLPGRCLHWWTSPRKLLSGSPRPRYQTFLHPDRTQQYCEQFRDAVMNELMKWSSVYREQNVSFHSHLVLGFVEAVGQSSSCWLIDHTQDVQTSDLTGVFGCLSMKNKKI